MKDKFTQLLDAIETEIYDQALRMRSNLLDGAEINDQYSFGYRAALLFLLGKARSIQSARGNLAKDIPVIYLASVTEFDRFVRAYEDFILPGKKRTT